MPGGAEFGARKVARYRKYVFRKVQGIVARQAEIVFASELCLRNGRELDRRDWVKYMALEMRKKKLMEGL